tara:strand:+ start:170 stop:877 length:708 start_codon:yes stop_codon:yes gene_type:complete
MELQNIEKTFYSEGENIGGYTFDKRKGYMKDDGRFILNKEPIPYLLAKNYFSDEDIDSMLTELRFITPKMNYNPPSGDIPQEKGEWKQNNQIYLDDLYTDRSTSTILNCMNKIYDDKDLIHALKSTSWFYNVWNYTNLDQSFVAYYENTDFYKAHRDIAIISIMYWIWEEPKSFTGGDLHLTNYNIEIPMERNQLLIMPSSINHAVDAIQMNKEYENQEFSGMGRYCVARFLKMK